MSSFGETRRGISGTDVSRALLERKWDRKESTVRQENQCGLTPERAWGVQENLCPWSRPLQRHRWERESPGPPAERQVAARPWEVASPRREGLWLGSIACKFLPHRTCSSQEILLRNLSWTCQSEERFPLTILCPVGSFSVRAAQEPLPYPHAGIR